MAPSRFTFSIFKRSDRRSHSDSKRVLLVKTLWMTVLFAGTIGVILIAASQTIPQIFSKTSFLWLEEFMKSKDSWFSPIGGLFLLALGVMKLYPKPKKWSRTLVGLIVLTLAARYVYWRVFSTLNLDTPLNGVFSLGLLGMELLILASINIQFLLVFKIRDRSRDADRMSSQIAEVDFCPSVDILIPTYDEPAFILKRTIVGCQALDYDQKTIYLLDDTRRPNIQKLARELGCEYISRSNNLHAKAGNLNNALDQTHGELVVVFDADFVPTKNFLSRIIGFFKDKTVGLVQTPQSFYNADPIARNLGLENLLTPEEEIFYRSIQPIRDGVGSVVCCGTSFVVRRSALEKTGGFVTESLSEDYFTGIRLSAHGYRLIYLDEKLSAGLAPENIAAHASQRLRWARGTLQAFFITSNPLTIRGLRPIQRLAHLEGLLYWFTSLSRVGLLMMPLAYSFLGVIPIRATFWEFLSFCLPYYLLKILVFYWFNYCSRSAFLSSIYSFILAFPLAFTAIQVVLNPFSKGFKVTPKGKNSDQFYFNWQLAFPLILLLIATAIAFWKTLMICLMTIDLTNLGPKILPPLTGLEFGWIWSAYNLFMIGIALLILFDAPKIDRYEWFDLRRLVKLSIDGRQFWGVTTLISEAGMQVELTQAGFPSMSSKETLPVNLKVLEEGLELSGEMTKTNCSNDFSTVRIDFEELSLDRYRQLVEMLFCRPGQWKHRCAPGEIHSLWLLLKVLLQPRILFDRARDVSVVTVSQV